LSKEEDDALRGVRGERIFLFVIIIIIRITAIEPYTLGFTVTSDGLRSHIESLLWDLFCDFLDIFPTHRE
jgi:hypothetical protein